MSAPNHHAGRTKHSQALSWFPAYRRDWLLRDVLAGLAVWAVMVPEPGSSGTGEHNDHPIGHRNPGIPHRSGTLRKFNDDCTAFKHVHIWAFRRIRGNCRPHSAITHIGRPDVTYEPDCDDAGGDWSERLLAPPASFLTTGNLSSLAIDEPAPALGDGDHCREMAGKLRQLARYTKSPGIRRELVGFAKRYDRRGEFRSGRVDRS